MNADEILFVFLTKVSKITKYSVIDYLLTVFYLLFLNLSSLFFIISY